MGTYTTSAKKQTNAGCVLLLAVVCPQLCVNTGVCRRAFLLVVRQTSEAVTVAPYMLKTIATRLYTLAKLQKLLLMLSRQCKSVPCS